MLTVGVAGQANRQFDAAFLQALQPRDEDLRTHGAPREYGGVRALAVLTAIGLPTDCGVLRLSSSSDGYQTDVPVTAACEHGWFVDRCEGRPLTEQLGGPLRFFLAGAVECHTGDLDACLQIKYLSRLDWIADGETRS